MMIATPAIIAIVTIVLRCSNMSAAAIIGRRRHPITVPATAIAMKSVSFHRVFTGHRPSRRLSGSTLTECTR